MRGEHKTRTPAGAGRSGSSPRARGARRCIVLACPIRGIIPACAGSTARASVPAPQIWDHPRVRGEHVVSKSAANAKMGSSPRARGAPTMRRYTPIRWGIIPACAGSTSLTKSTRSRSRDHPRVRGEHATQHMRGTTSSGSSPRARGAHHTMRARLHRTGIIPACAGSTDTYEAFSVGM